MIADQGTPDILDSKKADAYFDWIKKKSGFSFGDQVTDDPALIKRSRCAKVAGKQVCVEDRMNLGMGKLVPIVIALGVAYLIIKK